MCGIAGIYMPVDGTHEKLFRAASLMISKLLQRGPDDKGVWVDTNVPLSLGHTRLSIIELSQSGHQPMESHSKRFVIVFNGEIYNHRKLRQDLEEDAGQICWRGGSDTETLLECIDYWGINNTLEKIVGMFSIAIWDMKKRVLTLARDRLGEKPLYWGWVNGSFVFASELSAIATITPLTISRSALALLLRHNFVPAPYSIYEGINKLQAGALVSIPLSGFDHDVTPIKYWDSKTIISSCKSNIFKGSEFDAVDMLEKLVLQSVESQMLSDVPVGAFLSGGVDSSVVASIMQKLSSSPIKTFSIGFTDTDFNESEYARAVAKHLATNHTEFVVSGKDALSVVPGLSEVYSEPFADSSQIPMYLVCKLARQFVTVCLSGDGGDELFGGYNTYRFIPKIWQGLKIFPVGARGHIASLVTNFKVTGKLGKLAGVLSSNSKEDLYKRVVSYWDDPTLLLQEGIEPSTQFSNPLEWLHVNNFQEWMMAMDLDTYLPDDILVKVDRAAMANSLETRVPFLDHRIVEFAWQLPLEYKIRGNIGKWVLRQLLYRQVPKALIERPKKGFSVPLGSWLKYELRDWAESLLNFNRLKSEGYFNAEFVDNIWKAHLCGKDDYSRHLWGILMFQSWLENVHQR